MFYFLLLISGIAGGILGGMGMGGGTLLIPILTIFFKISQKQAQAINLLSFLPMSVIAIILHIKNKLINIKLALILILPALIFSVLGSFLVSYVKGDLQSKLFGGFLILLSVYQFSVTVITDKKSKKQN